MKIQQVTIAAIRKNDKYLLTKRVKMDPEDIDYAPYVWHLPGGGIEKDETAENGLRREIKEELDIYLDKCILVPKTFVDTRRNWQGIFTIFLCTLKDYNCEIVLNEESSQYGWFTKEQVSTLKTLPYTVEMVIEADKIKI